MEEGCAGSSTVGRNDLVRGSKIRSALPLIRKEQGKRSEQVLTVIFEVNAYLWDRWDEDPGDVREMGG